MPAVQIGVELDRGPFTGQSRVPETHGKELLMNKKLAASCLLAALLPLGAACSGSGQGQGVSTAQAASAPPPVAQTSGSPTPTTGSASPASSPVASSSPTSGAQTASSGSAASSSAATDFRTAVRQVTEQVRPAIVQITNEQVQPGAFNQGAAVPAGVGSGVIYDNQGHILTNNHVVAGAQQLEVTLPDKRTFPGKVVGADPQTDLAVVQIQGSNLPVAQLGDSGQLHVGDWVVAIGNALALPGGPTVTQGVVSALGRTVQEPATPNPSSGSGGPGGGVGPGGGGGPGGGIGPGGGGQANAAGPFLFDVIQTDAPINPGNSGGALVNLDGQVVGINTLVAGMAEPGVQAQGIGFAIAMATAKPIADELVSTGHAVHPYLGIQYGQLTPGIAARLGVNVQSGAFISAVVPGSPAASAGLQPRDIITQVDGKALDTESALAEDLGAHKPGDTVTLTIIRNGQQQNVQVTLGQLPQGQG